MIEIKLLFVVEPQLIDGFCIFWMLWECVFGQTVFELLREDL